MPSIIAIVPFSPPTESKADQIFDKVQEIINSKHYKSTMRDVKNIWSEYNNQQHMYGNPTMGLKVAASEVLVPSKYHKTGMISDKDNPINTNSVYVSTGRSLTDIIEPLDFDNDVIVIPYFCIKYENKIGDEVRDIFMDSVLTSLNRYNINSPVDVKAKPLITIINSDKYPFKAELESLLKKYSLPFIGIRDVPSLFDVLDPVKLEEKQSGKDSVYNVAISKNVNSLSFQFVKEDGRTIDTSITGLIDDNIKNSNVIKINSHNYIPQSHVENKSMDSSVYPASFNKAQKIRKGKFKELDGLVKRLTNTTNMNSLSFSDTIQDVLTNNTKNLKNLSDYIFSENHTGILQHIRSLWTLNEGELETVNILDLHNDVTEYIKRKMTNVDDFSFTKDEYNQNPNIEDTKINGMMMKFVGSDITTFYSNLVNMINEKNKSVSGDADKSKLINKLLADYEKIEDKDHMTLQDVSADMQTMKDNNINDIIRNIEQTPMNSQLDSMKQNILKKIKTQNYGVTPIKWQETDVNLETPFTHSYFVFFDLETNNVKYACLTSVSWIVSTNASSAKACMAIPTTISIKERAFS